MNQWLYNYLYQFYYMSKGLLKEKAINLRMEGYSVKEISDKLSISKSTSSIWVRDLILNEKAKQRLIVRRLNGYQKISLHWKNKNIEEEKKYGLVADDILSKISKDPVHLFIGVKVVRV